MIMHLMIFPIFFICLRNFRHSGKDNISLTKIMLELTEIIEFISHVAHK